MSIETFLVSYLNTLNRTGKKYQIGGTKKFTITYKNHKYVFVKLERFMTTDDDVITLYSYDDDTRDCVTLSIEKNNKAVILTSFGSDNGCYHEESNIGSNLLKITLKMIEKYKDKLGVDKILLSDNSTYMCSVDKMKYNMGIMMTLLTGDTWYGKYGFRPYENYKLNKVQNKIYNENKKIMTTITMDKINLKKYLLKIHKKYPEEMTEDMVYKLLKKQNDNPNKLLITFLNELHGKDVFESTCHLFYVYYQRLFNDIGLKIAGHIYGKKIE